MLVSVFLSHVLPTMPINYYNRPYEDTEVQALQSQAQSISQAVNQCCRSYLQSLHRPPQAVLPNVGRAPTLFQASGSYCQVAEA